MGLATRAWWIALAVASVPVAAAQETPPDLAWRAPAPGLPASTLPQGPAVLLGRFREPARPLAFSADGKLLAFFQCGLPTDGVLRPIHVIDTTTGQIVRTLAGRDRFVNFAAFSPDGKTLATHGMDRALCYWDVATGKPLGAAPPQGLEQWEITTRKPLEPDANLGKRQPVFKGVLSPDGVWRAWATGAMVNRGPGADRRGWGYPEPNRSKPFTFFVAVAEKGMPSLLLAGDDYPEQLLLSHDGSRLAWGGKNGGLTVWDCKTGKLLRTLGLPVWPVLGLRFAAGGKRLLSLTADGLVHAWDVADGKELRRADLGFPGGAGTLIHTVAAGLAFDVAHPELGLWDLATGKRPGCCTDALAWFPNAAGPLHPTVGFSANGAYLVGVMYPGGGDSVPRLVVWDTHAGTRKRSVRAPNADCALAVSNDGGMVATAVGPGDRESRNVVVWEAASGKPRCKFRLPSDETIAYSLGALTFSPDGRYLAALDLCGGERERPRDGRYPVPDDSLVQVWDIVAGKHVRTLQGHEVPPVFSPDSTRLAVPRSRGLEVLDLKSGKVGRDENHWEEVRCLAWRDDGNLVATAGEDGAVILWDVGAVLKKKPE
jgi:WD40 repeat protein